MDNKVLPTGRCHSCNKAVKNRYLYCYTCNEARKRVDDFIKTQKEKRTMKLLRCLEVTFVYSDEVIPIDCCIINISSEMLTKASVASFVRDVATERLEFDDWFCNTIVNSKVSILETRSI